MFLTACFFALLVVCAVALDAPADCYFATGKPAALTSPCQDASSGLTGLCCGHGHMCLNNTLCFKMEGGHGVLYRGTCSDPTWSNPSCPRYCIDDENKSTLVAVYPCGDNKDGTFRFHCGKQISRPEYANCKLSNSSFVVSGTAAQLSSPPWSHCANPGPQTT